MCDENCCEDVTNKKKKTEIRWSLRGALASLWDVMTLGAIVSVTFPEYQTIMMVFLTLVWTYRVYRINTVTVYYYDEEK